MVFFCKVTGRRIESPGVCLEIDPVNGALEISEVNGEQTLVTPAPLAANEKRDADSKKSKAAAQAALNAAKQSTVTSKDTSPPSAGESKE